MRKMSGRCVRAGPVSCPGNLAVDGPVEESAPPPAQQEPPKDEPLIPQDHGASSPLPQPAKRYRYAQKDPLDIRVCVMPCVVGKRLKTPVCLPTMDVEGVQMMRWAAKEAWVNQVVAGRVDCSQIDAAGRRVRDKLVSATRAASTQDEDEAVAVAGAGREALGLEDDSGSDAGAEELGCQPGGGRPGGCQPGPRPGRRKGGPVAPKASAVQSVELSGVVVRVAILKRVLWIECSAEIVRTLADEICRELVPKALQVARERCKQREEQLDGGPCGGAELRGRIYFASEKETWVVVYRDGAGRRCFSQKALAVPARGPHGNLRSTEEYTGLMRAKLQAAKKEWNKLDRSGRDRFVD